MDRTSLRNGRRARAAAVIRCEAKTIARLEERLGEGFDVAVERVLDCQGQVVVTGMGKAGLVGQKISATLASTGTPSFYLHPARGPARGSGAYSLPGPGFGPLQPRGRPAK